MIAILLVAIMVVSVFSSLQQKPREQPSASLTLRPDFFTLPFTYFNFSPSVSSLTLSDLTSDSLSGNYTNLAVTINYSGLQPNTSSPNIKAFNILGEQNKEGSGPIIISGYLLNRSGWFAQSSFCINGTQKIIKTASVGGFASATNDQIIIRNNQLTIKQSGIILIDAYSLPPNFYIDSALSEGSPNGWIGGNVYAFITGTVSSNSVTAEIIGSLEKPPASPDIVSLDGNLETNISTVQRNLVWEGEQLNEVGNWFAGDEGTSTIVLGYNFSASQSPFGICDINFNDASGNRPFPYMSYSNYAIPKIYYSSVADLEVHFDIKMLDFTTNDLMRTAVVVELIDRFGHPYYFEQDIKDSAKETLPYLNSAVGVWEQVYANASIGQWVHFDIPFNGFINTYAPQIAPNCFIGAFYLVNECFGSGYVNYNVANWWLTV